VVDPASPKRSIHKDWFVRTFDELYPVVYAHRTVKAAAPEALFAIRELAVQPGERVLDLGCGNGRHLDHFLTRTQRVIGLDFSQHLLDIARERLGDRAQLVRADMREIPFTGSFDVLVNFFTSFGYFSDESENRTALAEAAQALRPGGRFLIDYLNATYVRKTLMPQTVRHEGNLTITETRWIDEVRHRVNKKTVVTGDGGDEVARTGESVRLYTLPEFEAMLDEVGLVLEHTFGNYDRAPLDDTQPRLILAGHRAR